VSDITVGLPRVEELFEARVPKGAALLADIDGEITLQSSEDTRVLRVVYSEEVREEYPLPEGAEVLVDDGDMVEPGMILASSLQPEGTEDGQEISDTIELANVPVLATVGGRVEVSADCISVIWEDVETREHVIPAAAYLLVSDGDWVNAGDALTSGPLNPHDLLRVLGKDSLQSHLVDQVQAVYQSQGVGIHDKHIEIILRQMLRRVQVKEPGDTEFIPGEVVDKFAFQEQVAKVLAEGGEPATADQVLLGVTRASLRTDSFLSAASFQETTRVLTEAAVRGQQDYLLGLKENVIIGRLIPAQVEIPGMAELLKPQPALDLSAVAPGSWLRGPAEAVEDEVDLGILGPDAEEDGFERMARQVARTYAKDETDEEEVEDLFDDDDDEEEVVAQGEVAPESEVAVESEVAAEGEVLPIGLAE
jgi:DNA-directed RNA polymerase subunit beta'